MKKWIGTVLFMLLLIPATGRCFDLGDIGKKLEQYGAEEALKTLGVDLNLEKVTGYLDWETVNVSLVADMSTATKTLGATVTTDSRVYKKSITGVRIDNKSTLDIPWAEKPVMLSGSYMLRYPLEKEAYLVLPAKKTYMELDPERTRELLGEMKERYDDKRAKIEHKEKLGTETLDGYTCEKIHLVMTLASGMKCDIHAWLAQELNRFPIKIINDFTTAKGVEGTTRVRFTNIQKKVPDERLFEIPEDYIECKNIVQLITGGKFGKRLKKPGERKRLFKRRR